MAQVQPVIRPGVYTPLLSTTLVMPSPVMQPVPLSASTILNQNLTLTIVSDVTPPTVVFSSYGA